MSPKSDPRIGQHPEEKSPLTPLSSRGMGGFDTGGTRVGTLALSRLSWRLERFSIGYTAWCGRLWMPAAACPRRRSGAGMTVERSFPRNLSSRKRGAGIQDFVHATANRSSIASRGQASSIGSLAFGTGWAEVLRDCLAHGFLLCCRATSGKTNTPSWCSITGNRRLCSLREPRHLATEVRYAVRRK